VIAKLLAMMPMQALHDLVTACLADTRTSLQDLRVQLQQEDDDGVRRTAHRIKGAASMVGATRLARLAAEIESGGSKKAASPGVLDDLLSACSELERMLLAGKLTQT
jgi:HPt (histidine-containing phosphotransfer) domain-containing protein